MTIYALSTAPGRAGIAVVRISGDRANDTLQLLCQGKAPSPRLASLRTLRDPSTGEILDRAVVLWLPGPGSFTGEDMAELHIHGGRAVLTGVLDTFASLGLRIAEPGEFTKRAFENGKLDLTEVEGLSDLINADTSAQRRQALAQANGVLRGCYEDWRSALLRAMAYVEASLDFSDEGDVADAAFYAAIPEVRALEAKLDRALADGRRGEIVREGIQVAIVGAPNVGKSSLLNALVGRDAAIVFDEPGTTRDVIEVALDFDGFPFVFRDTAGLRDAASLIEREGIRRALATAADADVVLLLEDASAEVALRPVSPSEESGEGALAEASESSVALARLWEKDKGDSNAPKLLLRVKNKIDLAPPKQFEADAVPISVKTGQGLDHLREALVAFARLNYGSQEAPLITRARHRQEIKRARNALAQFLENVDGLDHAEIAAEHLREAADALARLTGRLDVEHVLGQIFSEFCIGK